MLGDEGVDHFGRTFSAAKYAAARLRISFSSFATFNSRRSIATLIGAAVSGYGYILYFILKAIVSTIKILDVIQFYIATNSHPGFGAKQGP